MTAAIDVHHFSGPEDLAHHAAQRWLGAGSPDFQSVALSGGRIAAVFFAAAAKLAVADPNAARKIRQTDFYWADERCVPPDSVESNFRVARENLFDPLGLGSAGIHRIQGELEPDAAVAAANAAVGRIPRLENGLPVFDLVFLGMGEDGHVASLFDAKLEGSGAAYELVRGPKPPNPRITLSFRALGMAKEVWVLISGPGKELALRNSLEGKAITPLGRVIQSRRSTVLLIDGYFFEHRRS